MTGVLSSNWGQCATFANLVQKSERLTKVKEGRDEAKAQQSLENLTQAAMNALNNGENGNNCLAASVECARARCSVGEITDAMAKVVFYINFIGNFTNYEKSLIKTSYHTLLRA